MVSVWYKQEDAELEPLEDEVDYTITTIEELLNILPENFEPEGEERNGNGFIYVKMERQFIIILWAKAIRSYLFIRLMIIIQCLMM